MVIESLNMTTAEFARKSDLSYRTLQSYLRAERMPTGDNLAKLYARMNINLIWLLTGEGEMFVPKTTTFLGGKGRLFFAPAKEATKEDEEKLGVLEKICLMLDDMPKEQLYDLAKHIEDKKQALEDKKRLIELEKKFAEILKKDCG